MTQVRVGAVSPRYATDSLGRPSPERTGGWCLAREGDCRELEGLVRISVIPEPEVGSVLGERLWKSGGQLVVPRRGRLKPSSGIVRSSRLDESSAEIAGVLRVIARPGEREDPIDRRVPVVICGIDLCQMHHRRCVGGNPGQRRDKAAAGPSQLAVRKPHVTVSQRQHRQREGGDTAIALVTVSEQPHVAKAVGAMTRTIGLIGWG